MKRLITILLLLFSLAASAQINDTALLRSYVNANIITNGNRQITGLQLNTIFNGYLNIMRSYKVGRAVDSVYKINDSTIGYKINGTSYSFEYKGTGAGGGLAGDSNNYTTGISFGTGTGLFNLTRNGLSSLNISLDGRYFKLSDTLAAFAGYSRTNHTHTFASLTSKPTTLSGYGITDAVPASRTLTINGTTYDLSANRSWTIAAGGGGTSGITELGSGHGLIVVNDSTYRLDTTISATHARLANYIAAVETSLGQKLNQADSSWGGFYPWSNPLGFIAENETITLSGDVTGSGKTGIPTTIAANAVSNSKFRQSAGTSVVGRSANSTGNVADLAGTTDQVLRVNSAGSSLGFGSIDLSKSGTVGSSVLPIANGGTNLSSLGTANQQLRVNAGATALEYFTPSAGGGGVTRVGTLDSLTKVARGGQVVTDANGTPTLILQTADATYPGLLGTGSQTFAGDKTFNGTLGFGFTTNDVAYFKMRTVGAGNNSGIGWNGGNIWQFYNPSSASYSFNGGGDFNATSTTNQWASISSAQITHSTKIQAPLFSSGSTASGVHQYYRPAGSGANTGVGYVTGYCQFFQYSGYGFTWNGSGDLQTTVGTNEWLRLDATGLYTPSGKKMAVGTISPSSSTILDVASTSLASRPSPPMTGGQRDAISSPATGATIYNNDNRAISQYNGSNWINDVVVSSAGSLTLKYGNDYVFTGSTSTWTLPAITANVIGRTNGIKIKNRGSGAITLNTSTGSTLYTTAAASTITINAGAACELLPDGTYNLVLFNQ